jgi:hypothetical protein
LPKFPFFRSHPCALFDHLTVSENFCGEESCEPS